MRKNSGNSLTSPIWLTLASYSATAIILSSASPLSIIRITPITFDGIMHKGTTETWVNTTMSNGS